MNLYHLKDGDLMTHEPTGTQGRFQGFGESDTFWERPIIGGCPFIVTPDGFERWWHVSRNGETIHEATHDPAALRQGLIQEKPSPPTDRGDTPQ